MGDKNVLIAGGSGFIGRYLTSRLKDEGFRVSILSRSESNQKLADRYFNWDPEKGIIERDCLKNQQFIINLTGAGIADRIWTRKRKKHILNSRVESTRLLIKTLKELKLTPKLFINASAVGYYGHRPGETLTEQSERGTGFLSQVCYEWEKAVKVIPGHSIPFVIIRLGIVLGMNGGSLPKLLKPFRFGLNMVFGKGNQPMVWIHVEDVFRIILESIEGRLSPGIYNAIAPEAVTQEYFNTVLLQLLNKKAIKIRIPERLLWFFLGELASIFTNYQQIVPERLVKEKFEFRYPLLRNALHDLIKK